MPFVEVEGTSLYYHVQGKGVPIIFVHPPLLTSINFKYQVNELSKEFQTIVFDIRGHGNSSFSKEAVTYSRISKDIKQILDHLQLKQAFLCGYSTGGTVVLDFLLTYPKRAQGAILLGPMPEVNDWRLKQELKLAIFFSKNKLVTPLRYAICYSNANDKLMFQTLFHEAKKGSPENIKQYYQASLTYQCTESLENIKTPTLLLYGAKDDQFHQYARTIQAKVPNSQLHFIQNATHQLPTKAAKEINTFIKQFVREYSIQNLAYMK